MSSIYLPLMRSRSLMKKIALEQGPLSGLFHAAGISVILAG